MKIWDSVYISSLESVIFKTTSFLMPKKISDLLSKTVYAGSVLVPKQGWLTYGGVRSPLTTAQQLKSLDGKWEAGPALFEGKPDWNGCIVQVKI